MDKYICIHGHFYQPPRENPWFEEIELQESAHPYHDWNERITAECYAPNSASRILGTDGSIIDIVNNYAKINFNFGPTLLSWIERRQPEVYQAILEADRISAKRFSGHGSAMAQIYNHMIMPLANRRDKLTAVDLETLEVLAEFGILFTILSPHQAGKVKPISEGEWKEVKEGEIDPSMPYLCKLPSGKSINIFFYDGPISREVAFGNLLSSGDLFASKLSGAFREERNRPQIVHIATDGETFGHHQPHADMALAYTLFTIESKNIAKLTNYGEYLAKNPPSQMIEIIEKSSWSCSHGVERWRSNCGCNIGKFPGGKQPWRAPLREGMDWLRDQAAAIYEEGASDMLRNPWEARDEYIEVIAHRSRVESERFLRRHQVRMLDEAEMSRTLRLLEMQRYAMLMYTSCGWFFDDISGIESVQIMQYACRAIQLAEEIKSVALEPKFVEYLRNAPSLLEGDGAIIYEKFVKPSRIDLKKAGAHHALLSLFDPHQEHSKFYFYSLHNHEIRRSALGRLRWVT
ncbi:MAG: DUF3536 domain-containing protein, partial [Nitrospirae bacterium]|nr:DUF3536 domain-containing protein [Nitrospirota bacterium]